MSFYLVLFGSGGTGKATLMKSIENMGGGQEALEPISWKQSDEEELIDLMDDLVDEQNPLEIERPGNPHKSKRLLVFVDPIPNLKKYNKMVQKCKEWRVALLCCSLKDLNIQSNSKIALTKKF